jgi:hypothetical protein
VFTKKTTGGFSSVPYVVALFSCVLWIFYALIKTNSRLLLTINAFGCGIEFIYIAAYLVYAPRRARLRTLAYFFLLDVAAFGLVVALTLKAVGPQQRVKFLGSVCLAFSMAVFVAPLSVIVSSGLSLRSALRSITSWATHDMAYIYGSVGAVQGDQDQERGVPARRPLRLPRPQRRRLVLLRPLHPRPIRHGT